MGDQPLGRRELAVRLIVDLNALSSHFDDVWMGGLNTRRNKASCDEIKAQPSCSFSAALGWRTPE